MKLPVTDQFLWELYEFMEETGDVVHSFLRSRRTLYDILPENPVFAKYRHMKSKRIFTWLIYYLKKNNYIKVKNLQGKQAIILTKKGIGKALRASFEKGEKRKRKDGKWLMVIFDIPQKHAKSRSLMRSILKNLEYKILQQSVWVTPYDVSGKTEKLLQFYDLDKYVKIFLIEAL